MITAIAPNGSTAMDIVVDTSAGASLFSEAYGTNLIVANKLGFGSVSVDGLDGYRRNTGLLAEANRIVFGDETDVVNYEGIASAGASYNMAGPLVKRVKIALAIRRYTGVSMTSVKQQVQSSVAAVINKSNVGKSIAISSVVAAAKVNGVEAVTVLAPSYGVGSDLIVVQPYEKALVADLEGDISVTFVGE